MLWESSIYKFRIPFNDGENDNLLKEIVFDVTFSAPNFVDPPEGLKAVIQKLFEHFIKKPKINILDFGAAKLRNTLYMLDKGHDVCAVEFESLFNKDGQIQEMLNKARSHGKRFRELVFPHAFIDSNEKFDLALLVNVISTMPIPAERLLVLQHCHKKLKKGGLLLYYSMYGEHDYKKRCTEDVKIGDGYYIGERKFKSFFREFNDLEIDLMFLSSGFEFVEKFTVKGSKTRLYRKKDPILLDGFITTQHIEDIYNAGKLIELPKEVEPKKSTKADDIQAVIPNPLDLEIKSLWIKKLNEIPLGHPGATEFHRVSFLMLRYIFEPDLRNFKIEDEINEGRKRIDIVATNSCKEGFFKWLVDQGVRCPWVIIECKNYEDMENPEVDQLAGRLITRKNQFGFLVYRGKTHTRKILQRCKDFVQDDKYIIPLNEADLIKLLELRQSNDEEEEIDFDEKEDVTNYLDERFKELIIK